MHKQKKAFTIVELIVVVTILAILSTIGFVSYSSYLIGVRDTNRISNLKSVFDGMVMYRTESKLPLPDDKIEIKSNGTLIARQGYAGANVLETIEFSSAGKDPKDDTYYSYYLTRDRRTMQLMGFLEDASNSPEKPVLSTSEERYPIVYGDKLGILTGTGTDINVPIQAISSIQTDKELDISTTTTLYSSHMRDNEIASGTGTVLFKMEEIARVSGYFCGASNDVLYCAQTPLFSENLIGYWDFESNFIDSSVISNFTMPNGNVSVSNTMLNSGRNNYAIFDGTDDYLEVSDHFKYQLDNGTVSLRFKVNNISSTNGLFSRDADDTIYPGHFTIKFLTDATIRVRSQKVSNNYYVTSSALTWSNWNNVIVTFGSNGLKLYINGILVDTDTHTGGWSGNNNPLGIGVNTQATPDDNMDSDLRDDLDGYMDDVMIYDRELTASEALELYYYQK